MPWAEMGCSPAAHLLRTAPTLLIYLPFPTGFPHIYQPTLPLGHHTKCDCRPNHIMAHTTAKLGGPASGVVIAKVGVSFPVLLYFLHSLLTALTLSIAWAYEDDLDTNACAR